jgi:2-amino-4-hydroxy-6-hydroxymethyldihydropteridine diphosphokinase
MMMTNVILLLGSNDSHACEIIDKATLLIGLAIGEVVQQSKDYTTAPYGFSADNNFVNRALEVETDIDAYELLRRINTIEESLGRNRDEERAISASRGEQYASRPIDIDIIFYGDESFDDERLVIPYHFLAEREYALRPLAEIAPNRRHPALEHTPREMLDELTKKCL